MQSVSMSIIDENLKQFHQQCVMFVRKFLLITKLLVIFAHAIHSELRQLSSTPIAKEYKINLFKKYKRWVSFIQQTFILLKLVK